MGKSISLALLTVFFSCFAASNAQSQQAPPVAVNITEVRNQTIEDSIEALGTLRANESVELTANVTETISEIYFHDGERVKRNQLLVELTNSEEKALLTEAKTVADEAARQLARIRSLAAKGSVSQADLDERQQDYDAARARLIVIESQLKDREIRAPFDGQVGLRRVSPGSLVKPGDVITTLTDNQRMKLDFPIPALYLASMKTGVRIEATTPVYPGQKFEGEVVSIDNQVDPATRSIEFRALLPNESGQLKQGMLMQIDLLFNTREALLVQDYAIVPEGEDNYVWLVAGNEFPAAVEKRQIAAGKHYRDSVEILDGLQPGDRIVSDGAFKLRPNARVVLATQQDSTTHN